MARRPNLFESERVSLSYDNASISATTTVRMYKVPAGRTFRLDRASHVNPTGLAANASNYFTATVKNAATVANTVFNTITVTGAALVADTYAEGVPSATDANLVFQAGDVVSLIFTLTGTQTLPVGHTVIEGRLF